MACAGVARGERRLAEADALEAVRVDEKYNPVDKSVAAGVVESRSRRAANMT
jgi:hypothetical protein